MIDLSPYQIIAQGIGILASLGIISSVCFTKDNHLKIALTVGCCLFSLHFFLIGAYVGAFAVAINALRNLLSLFLYGNKFLICGFIITYLIVGFYRYEYIYDLLPVFSGIVSTIALFLFSGIKMRVLISFSSFSWLTYDIIYKSIGGVITESFTQILNIRKIIILRKIEKL